MTATMFEAGVIVVTLAAGGILAWLLYDGNRRINRINNRIDHELNTTNVRVLDLFDAAREHERNTRQ